MGCYWAAPVASSSLSASTPLAGFYYAAPLDLNVCSLGDVAAHGLPAAARRLRTRQSTVIVLSPSTRCMTKAVIM